MTLTTTMNLADLDQEAYASLVDREIRGDASSELADAFRQPENIERWYTQLVTIKQSVESQLGGKRSEIVRRSHEIAAKGGRHDELAEERATYERWRASVLRFKSGVETRIAEVSSLRRQYLLNGSLSHVEMERNTYGVRVSELVAAIVRHCEQTLDNEYEPNDFDIELWATAGLKVDLTDD